MKKITKKLYYCYYCCYLDRLIFEASIERRDPAKKRKGGSGGAVPTASPMTKSAK